VTAVFVAVATNPFIIIATLTLLVPYALHVSETRRHK
jgi:hypothetical protein